MFKLHLRVPKPSWRLIAIFPKETAEVAIVLETQIIGYLGDGLVRVGEEAFSLEYDPVPYHLTCGFSFAARADSIKIVGRDMQYGRIVCHQMVFLKVLLYQAFKFAKLIIYYIVRAGYRY